MIISSFTCFHAIKTSLLFLSPSVNSHSKPLLTAVCMQLNFCFDDIIFVCYFVFLELVCNLKTFKILDCSLTKVVKLKFLSVSELVVLYHEVKCSCDLPHSSYKHDTFVSRHHYCTEWHCANCLSLYWCYSGGLPFHYQKHFKQAIQLLI